MRFILTFLMLVAVCLAAQAPLLTKIRARTLAQQQDKPNLTWGPVGHASVAAIAQTYLTPNAVAAVTRILPDVQGDMSQVASWADDIRRFPAFSWSGPLHFINTPDWVCNYNRQRDCKNDKGVPMYCVDGAIQNYTARITNANLDANQVSQALKFLIHFVGDVHQPLHCGFTSDLGGNDIIVNFEGKSSQKLHGVWDSGMISKRISDKFYDDKSQWQAYLTKRTTEGDWAPLVNQWKSCKTKIASNACSDEWASESVSLACSNAYVAADGTTHLVSGMKLGDDYYNRNIAVVELQIAKAAVRLANILNTAFP